MYEQFGVPKQSDGTYAFRLFVPDNTMDPSQYVRGRSKITGVKAVGDFQPVLIPAGPLELRTGSSSSWTTPAGGSSGTLPPTFPDGYYQYKYVVKFKNGSVRWVGDPCTKYGGTQLNNSAFVIGGNTSPRCHFATGGCPGRTWSSTS